MLDRKKLIKRLLEETFCQRDSDCKSQREQRRTAEPVLEGLIGRGEVLEMIEDAINQLTDKLEAQVVHVAIKTLVDIMKTVDTDHNK